MSPKEQIATFGRELDKFVDKFAREFELSVAAAVGTLFIKAVSMVLHQKKKNDNESQEG